jgi:hypothetical protein
MVDFSEASNTTDHDKLLQIKHDVGAPTDAATEELVHRGNNSLCITIWKNIEENIPRFCMVIPSA